MEIHFFDDPQQGRLPREEVRFNQLGLYVYEDGRRVAVGFDITPFQERPSIDVAVRNEAGDIVGTLTVIEALQPNFHLTLHLRDEGAAENYELEAQLYYLEAEERRRLVVDRLSRTFDATQPGDQ
ncbi:MAG: hypothetical protein R3300_09835 [Candidatus Promineifilaceae bacterium]|nr:hypothetical protein [Candidatus Promineifilaceae bacterium]